MKISNLIKVLILNLRFCRAPLPVKSRQARRRLPNSCFKSIFVVSRAAVPTGILSNPIMPLCD